MILMLVAMVAILLAVGCGSSKDTKEERLLVLARVQSNNGMHPTAS